MRPEPSRLLVILSAAGLASAVSLAAPCIAFAAGAARAGSPAGAFSGRGPAGLRPGVVAPSLGFSAGGSPGPLGSNRVASPAGRSGAVTPAVGFTAGGVAGGAYGLGAAGQGPVFPGNGLGYGGYGWGGVPFGYGDGLGDRSYAEPAPRREPRWPTTIGIPPSPVQPPALYVIGSTKRAAALVRPRPHAAAPSGQGRLAVASAPAGSGGPLIIRLP